MSKCTIEYGPESLSSEFAGESRPVYPERMETNLKDLFTIGTTIFTEVSGSLDE